MKNQVIEVLNIEHGKKVIEYWRNKKVDTRYLDGSRTKEGENPRRYYGIIDNVFFNYSLTYVNKVNAEIITLPGYPKVMRVSNRPFSYEDQGSLRVVFMEKCGKYLAWNNATTIEDSNYILDTTVWNYAEDPNSPIFKEPEIEEMTLEQVCKELGRIIKIVK